MPSIRVTSVRTRLLLVALLCGVARGSGTGQAVHPTAPEPGVDSLTRPGDDFFGYANGEWLRTTHIPAGREAWTARDEIRELTARQVAQVLADAASEIGRATCRERV